MLVFKEGGDVRLKGREVTQRSFWGKGFLGLPGNLEIWEENQEDGSRAHIFSSGPHFTSGFEAPREQRWLVVQNN